MPLVSTQPLTFACYDASCRPPTSGGTGGSLPGGERRIAPRLPKGGQDHGTTSLAIEGLSPSNVQAQVDRLHAVGAVPEKYKTTEEVLGFMEANIQSVLDKSTQAERDAWKQWYPAANKMGADIAAEHGVEQVAANGVIAALSPGTNWDINVAMARSTIRTLAADQPVSAEVALKANALRQESWARELVAHDKKMAKAQGELDDLRARRERSSKPETLKDLDKAIAAKEAIVAQQPPAQPDIDHFKPGTKPSALSSGEAAYLIRASDVNPVVHENVVHPDGTYTNANLVMTKAGQPMKGAWQSYENIAKAIDIYRDPSLENLSTQLGKAHKVRTFFNNINNPHDPRNEATIDTHSAGIALGVPLSISHPWIKAGGQSVMSSPKHTADGTSGTYALMAEAHRRVALRNGLQPRELQSVTWEQWRRMHTIAERSANVRAINEGRKGLGNDLLEAA